MFQAIVLNEIFKMNKMTRQEGQSPDLAGFRDWAQHFKKDLDLGSTLHEGS